jgi:hypothetical protein
MISSSEDVCEKMYMFGRIYEHASEGNILAASLEFTDCETKDGTSCMALIAEVSQKSGSSFITRDPRTGGNDHLKYQLVTSTFK